MLFFEIHVYESLCWLLQCQKTMASVSHSIKTWFCSFFHWGQQNFLTKSIFVPLFPTSRFISARGNHFFSSLAKKSANAFPIFWHLKTQEDISLLNESFTQIAVFWLLVESVIHMQEKYLPWGNLQSASRNRIMQAILQIIAHFPTDCSLEASFSSETEEKPLSKDLLNVFQAKG